MNSTLNMELQTLLSSILSAGHAIEVVRQKGITAQYKANRSPLTEADLLANDILKSNLSRQFPSYGWLSEETIDDHSRFHCERIWIVDPIDGTKEFIKNIPEYAISVALVEHNTPILSAIYNPARQELFYAVKQQGTWFNHQPIEASPITSDPFMLLASRTEVVAGHWNHLKKNHSIRETGSIAYKLALVAKGEAKATISFTPKSEWDIAAGVLLVAEANGKVTDLKGNPFLFNQKNIHVNGVIAAHKHSYDHLIHSINAHQ